MDEVFRDFRLALADGDGYGLAAILSPVAPENDAGRLYAFYRSSNAHQIDGDVRYAVKYSNSIGLSRDESSAWNDVFVSYWKAVGEILAAEEGENMGKLKDGQWASVYEAWKSMTILLIKYHLSNIFPAWSIPCLYLAGKYLRIFAIKADSQSVKVKGNVTFNAGFQDDVVSSIGKNDKLEDAARQLNRMFSLCLGDRAPIEDSRKWGTYYTANLLFKTHFKLNAISLSKNIIRSIQAQADLPTLDLFPKSHQVTFKYYVGVITFLQEDYVQAEDNLTQAWQLCQKHAIKNQQLILTYLIPCRLLTKHTLPTSNLLDPYPRLQSLFSPLAACIKQGNLAGFDAALQAGEDEFVKRRIYLTLERGRDITLRNLLRKVFLAGGYEPLKEGQTEADLIRRTRIPIIEFAAAIRLGMGPDGQMLDNDEVECMIANMIYKNLMKGYIARERSMVVLNKKGAFPGTGV
ncbi:hypothetical protein K432DRAFT_26873 [Lepidopterella palustris CBS 459.81]|uniref:Protein CSN12 homolog n=1 Tax=Lepidopterella palustris CBS 459.81 TaxID=1314670 RepID=A0A8E2EKC7_9PEZI|nr:hypothetical protein K432DRAFT_26873 [Lepidopterella palustris CBS 459.81]